MRTEKLRKTNLDPYTPCALPVVFKLMFVAKLAHSAYLLPSSIATSHPSAAAVHRLPARLYLHISTYRPSSIRHHPSSVGPTLHVHFVSRLFALLSMYRD